MTSFDICFGFNNKTYVAKVINAGNIYKVLADDDMLAEMFGEIVLLEANGEFAWSNRDPEYYKYALSIATALKDHL